MAAPDSYSYQAERMGDIIERLGADTTVPETLRNALCESLRFQQGAAYERHAGRELLNEVLALQRKTEEGARRLEARLSLIEDPRLPVLEAEVRALREARVAADASLSVLRWAVPAIASAIPTLVGGALWFFSRVH